MSQEKFVEGDIQLPANKMIVTWMDGSGKGEKIEKPTTDSSYHDFTQKYLLLTNRCQQIAWDADTTVVNPSYGSFDAYSGRLRLQLTFNGWEVYSTSLEKAEDFVLDVLGLTFDTEEPDVDLSAAGDNIVLGHRMAQYLPFSKCQLDLKAFEVTIAASQILASSEATHTLQFDRAVFLDEGRKFLETLSSRSTPLQRLVLNETELCWADFQLQEGRDILIETLVIRFLETSCSVLTCQYVHRLEIRDCDTLPGERVGSLIANARTPPCLYFHQECSLEWTATLEALGNGVSNLREIGYVACNSPHECTLLIKALSNNVSLEVIGFHLTDDLVDVWNTDLPDVLGSRPSLRKISFGESSDDHVFAIKGKILYALREYERLIIDLGSDGGLARSFDDSDDSDDLDDSDDFSSVGFEAAFRALNRFNIFYAGVENALDEASFIMAVYSRNKDPSRMGWLFFTHLDRLVGYLEGKKVGIDTSYTSQVNPSEQTGSKQTG